MTRLKNMWTLPQLKEQDLIKQKEHLNESNARPRKRPTFVQGAGVVPPLVCGSTSPQARQDCQNSKNIYRFGRLDFFLS